MTGQRTSSVWKLEKEFGIENLADNIWQRFGPGTTITWTGNNNDAQIQSIGSKFWDVATYGNFSGTFTVNTKLDYTNIAYLLLAFESYSYNPSTGTHTFQKADGKRVPSFTQQIKILDRMVSGQIDETIKLLGFVVSTIAFKQDTNTSGVVTVTLSGFYKWEQRLESELDVTDFQPFEGELVEWLCLQIPPGNTVANVDKVSFGNSNNAKVQGSTCTRQATDYYEQQSTFDFATTVYANNGLADFYERFYSGGYATGLTEPKKKNLKPIPAVRITSSYDDTSTTFGAVIDITNVVVKTNLRGADPGSKMTEAPTFTSQKVVISITTNIGSLQSLLS